MVCVAVWALVYFVIAAAVNFALLSAKFCPRYFLSCACFVGVVEFTLLVWVALLAVIAAKLYERFKSAQI